MRRAALKVQPARVRLKDCRMPAIRTYTGRRRLLATVLWSSTYALLGCTDGIAEPIYSASEVAQNPAGRGAAGRGTAGHSSAGRGGSAGQQPTWAGHGAADGGDGRADAGNAGPPKGVQCDGAPPWSAMYADEEDALLDLLNASIGDHKPCADRGSFMRAQFPMMDESLRCLARQQAFLNLTGATWGRPPSGQGPGHDPFDPATLPDPIPASGSSASSARTMLLNNSMACGELTTFRYTRVGIGYISSTWVIQLAAE
jgi:hypothetical protein